jgi:hypothetical protein
MNKIKELSQERTAIRQAIQKTGLSPDSRNLIKRLKAVEKSLITEAHKHARKTMSSWDGDAFIKAVVNG